MTTSTVGRVYRRKANCNDALRAKQETGGRRGPFRGAADVEVSQGPGWNKLGRPSMEFSVTMLATSETCKVSTWGTNRGRNFPHRGTGKAKKAGRIARLG